MRRSGARSSVLAARSLQSALQRLDARRLSRGWVSEPGAVAEPWRSGAYPRGSAPARVGRPVDGEAARCRRTRVLGKVWTGRGRPTTG